MAVSSQDEAKGPKLDVRNLSSEELAGQAFRLLFSDICEDLELAHQLRTGGRPADTSRARRELLHLLSASGSNAGRTAADDDSDAKAPKTFELPEPEDIRGVSPEFRATVRTLSDTDRTLLRIALHRKLQLLQLQREDAPREVVNETSRRENATG